MPKKQEKMTLEKLAVMIKGGFDSVDERFKKMDLKIENVKKDLKEELKQFKEQNSREHEELRLRQDEVPYRFELNALTKRMEKVEKICFNNK